MIKAVFQDNLAFLAFAVALTLTAGAVAYVVAARRVDRVHAAFYGLWTSSTVGPVALTTWSGSGFLTYQCTINVDVTEAFASTQGQLNVLLFAPFGLFAVLATRRVLLSFAVGVLFTAIVETGQATLPFVSRLCDTDDLVTNTVGVLAGAAVGCIVGRCTRFGKPLSHPVVRRTVVGGTAAALLVAGVWMVVIEPVRAVLPTEAPTASPQQLQALNSALGKALGGGLVVSEANFHNNIEGPSTINAPLPGGYAELTWPDQEKLTVHFTPTSQGEGTYAYWIPGASRSVSTAEQAQQIATLYTQRHAAWALPGSQVKVWPVDAGDKNLGWIVERRRWQGKLLMPMRLDILIEPSGRMVDLIARNVADPKTPPSKLSEQQAWQRFDSRHKIKASQARREQPIYLVERRKDEWRIHWRLTAHYNGTAFSAIVDATTGEVHDAAAMPEGAQPSGAQGTPVP
ncbi:VanZ family protein [Streptomyces sp. NPDC012769]|uniref:VanZ family protein n=1 Tax=Streptomyces sp. NPDC012769 TaxID=3364848 RepID=UPI003693FC62